MNIQLLPGDIFCTRNPADLGKAIVAVEKLQAKDSQAEYGHSGIVTDITGTTLEALWTVKGNDLLAYKGDKVLIGRWKGMSPLTFQSGMEAISNQIHETYPWWRLLLMALGLGKVPTGKYVVCSELVCKFLIGAGVTTIGDFHGQNPDDVADMIRKWKEFEVIYEGVWE